MSGYFKYNGVKSSDLGIYVTGDGTYTVPSRQIKRTNIAGRNGDLLDDYQNYPNTQIVYHCSYQGNDINVALEALAEALYTGFYMRLEDSYHPDIYRQAIPVGTINPQALRPNDGLPHRAVNFDVTFSCKPQKFLESGSDVITVTGSSTITNPTGFHTKPHLTIYGSGTVDIEGQTIVVDSSCPENPVSVDCETMDAYMGATNCNPYVSLPVDDIVLVAGDNVITAGAGITQVQVIPRWWKI